MLQNLFKPAWQHSDANKRLRAVSKLTSRKKLRKIIDQSKDERLRFEAARRLDDTSLIKMIAYHAAQETVRLEASICINGQANLAAIALNAWDIYVGKRAVKFIDNRLLLHRVARSAKQDAIRLEAALKLGDSDLLRRVARSSNHIDVHWQVAKRLDDPYLLAEIIVFKPSNMRLEPLRRKARRALTEHLNRCQADNNHKALLAAMKAVPHVGLKIEAFVRLKPEQVTLPVLQYLSAQDFRYVPQELLDRMINSIQSGGWQVRPALQQVPCDYCQNKGVLSLKHISVNDAWVEQDVFPCPDCSGKGKLALQWAVCYRKRETVKLQLPV